MHEWIPVVAGAIMAVLFSGRASRLMRLCRVSLLAIIVVTVAREWPTASASLPLDLLFVSLGAFLVRGMTLGWQHWCQRPWRRPLFD